MAMAIVVRFEFTGDVTAVQSAAAKRRDEPRRRALVIAGAVVLAVLIMAGVAWQRFRGAALGGETIRLAVLRS